MNKKDLSERDICTKFINPAIEKAGWKGFKKNGVGVHDKQALVLVNLGGSAQDLLSLALEIQASILEKFSIELEIEPRVYRQP